VKAIRPVEATLSDAPAPKKKGKLKIRKPKQVVRPKKPVPVQKT
jgi:hypothetical protein